MSRGSGYYVVGFRIAAAWNIVIAIVMLVIDTWFSSVLDLTSESPPTWFYVAVGAVIVLGFGYYLVSRDTAENHGIVVLGILAKVGAIIAMAVHVYVVDLHPALLLPGAVDLAFTAFFIQFLVTHGPR